MQWDGKFADGTRAGPGQYPVIVTVTDIANRTVTASGTVIIPVPTPTPTPTSTPTGVSVSEESEPTATKPLAIAAVPTATPTPTPTATSTQAPTEEAQEEPTDTPPAVSMVLPTPQVFDKPPKNVEMAIQASARIFVRFGWIAVALMLGVFLALGGNAAIDRRYVAYRNLAKTGKSIREKLL